MAAECSEHLPAVTQQAVVPETLSTVGVSCLVLGELRVVSEVWDA